VTDEHDDAGPRGGGVVPVIHPDTRKRYFLVRINADVPLDGLMRDDEDGEQRTVLSRTIARMIGETWEQAPTEVDVPGSHD